MSNQANIDSQSAPLTDGEQTLAAYNGNIFSSAIDAEAEGKLFKMRSSWTYGDYTGLADLKEMIEVTAACVGFDRDSIVIVGLSEDETWKTIDSHLARFD